MPIEIVNKPIGYTPLQIIKLLQENKLISKYASVAGKLDPMATGLLKILTDIDCKQQDIHIKDSKIYEWDMIFGIDTDTSDILGIPCINDIFIMDFSELENIILKNVCIKGERIQQFSTFSSINVKSNEHGRKPLWWYAKNNLLHTIKIPEKKIEIYDFEIVNKFIIDKSELFEIIKNRLSLLKDCNNNFRQNEIINKWLEYENDICNDHSFIKLKCKAYVSTGCYIRQLSKEIASLFNTSAIAIDINRIKIGQYIKPTIYLDNLI